ncbi:MAG: bifunctional metallophosphatase/5'-nucleotidase [Bacteroidia bacterium]|nr:bifunctional metallophosphatase/5'-nucleotidase [Bacteroidia bacterium]
MNRPYFFISILFLALFSFSCNTTSQLQKSTKWEQVNLLQVNDVYEISPLEGGKAGGMARVASLKKQLLKETPHTYALLAGDFLSPSVIGTIKVDGERVAGEQMVDIMNASGINLVCFGNHEFDIKERDLQSRIDESEFSWIGGNVQQLKNGESKAFAKKGVPIPRYLGLKVLDNYTIGFVTACLPANKKDFVNYQDMYTSISSDYSEIKPKVDMVVGLTHLGIGMDRKVAERVPELSLIMGGHEHEAHKERVGEVPIYKADANAKSAWIHRIFVNKETKKSIIKSELVQLDENIPLDPEVQKKVQKWEEKALKAFGKSGIDLKSQVAVLKEPLDGLEVHIRTEQTNLGSAIAEAMYQGFPDLDACIFNGGSVRLDDYLSGTITQYDIVRTLPFGGGVQKVEMKGSLLRKILDTGLANKGSGGYLQWHNIGQEKGDWLIAGQPLQDSRIYAIAVSDFLMTGLERGLDCLKPNNPEITKITKPSEAAPATDIRMLLIQFLSKGN